MVPSRETTKNKVENKENVEKAGGLKFEVDGLAEFM